MFNPSEDNQRKIKENEFENYDPIITKSNALRPKEQMSVSEYLVAFYNQSKNYCVGCVDIVNSTTITKRISTTNGVKYNQIFLNSMSQILSRFGGFVIKNIGDCLLFYFPESSKSNRKFGFMSCIECCLSMSESHYLLCKKMHQENLPPVNYRVSADYGSVIPTITKNSMEDMIGPTITMCLSINHEAPMNEVVIGADLYERVKNFSEYKFKRIEDFSLGLKWSYPIYSVRRK